MKTCGKNIISSDAIGEYIYKLKLNSVDLVRKRTILAERFIYKNKHYSSGAYFDTFGPSLEAV
jgi:hypothetical protein